MNRLLVLAALWSAAQFLAAPALAQNAAPAAPSQQVVLQTPAGSIVIELDPRAPITSANFKRYVDEGRFDGAVFYRSMALAGGNGLIQGGVQNDPARELPPIAHEPTSQTGLRHTDGVVSMARYDPGTATGEFFIIVGDGIGSLDASATDSGFAAFGRVVLGMDVVRAILAAPKSPTAGEGVMRGQMLEPTIPITDAYSPAP